MITHGVQSSRLISQGHIERFEITVLNRAGGHNMVIVCSTIWAAVSSSKGAPFGRAERSLLRIHGTHTRDEQGDECIFWIHKMCKLRLVVLVHETILLQCTHCIPEPLASVLRESSHDLLNGAYRFSGPVSRRDPADLSKHLLLEGKFPFLSLLRIALKAEGQEPHQPFQQHGRRFPRVLSHPFSPPPLSTPVLDATTLTMPSRGPRFLFLPLHRARFVESRGIPNFCFFVSTKDTVR